MPLVLALALVLVLHLHGVSTTFALAAEGRVLAARRLAAKALAVALVGTHKLAAEGYALAEAARRFI